MVRAGIGARTRTPRPSSNRCLAGVVPIVAICTLTAPAQATPPDTYGFGVRSAALAGAVSADLSDPSANYHNPGGLARSNGPRFSLGYMSLHPSLSINDSQSDVERFGALQVGFIAPVHVAKVNVAFGLGLILPDQRIARTRSVVVGRPRWELYDTRAHRLFLAANLSIRPVEWLSFGAGIAFQAPSRMTLDIRGDLSVRFPEDGSRLRHQFEGDLTTIRYPQAGIQLKLHQRFALGLAYRGEYTLRNTIVATADVGVTIARLDFDLLTASTSLFGPQQLSLSAAIYPTDQLRIGLEVTWADWSGHPSLISTNDVDLALEPPLPGLEVPSDITAQQPAPLALHDVFVPRLGLEYRAVENQSVELDLRLGYAYKNSPFPQQRGITNFVDGDKHEMSAGLGVRLVDLEPTIHGYIALDTYFLFVHIPDRTHIKDSPVDPVGDYTAGGNLFGGGLQVELVFE